MRTTWTFHSAGSLVFGRNAAVQLGDIARRLPVGRLFIVTDAMLESVGVVERVIGPLREAGLTIEIFAGGKAEPSLKLVNECAAKARAFGPDCLVGLGGGSNMDVAKLTAVLLAHGGEARDYLGDDRIPGPIMPVICVSTTAGTGSEVSGAAAFTDTDNGVKVGCLSNQLRPRVAVVDPLLTVSCPPKVTADSGIDALTHAIEAFTAVDNAEFPLPADERSVYQGKHPMGDLCAEKAIRLCGQHLRAPSVMPRIWTHAKAWPLPRRWPGWRSPMSAWRWCMRWNIRSAGRRIAHTARATDYCSRTSCGSICPPGAANLPRSRNGCARTHRALASATRRY